MSTEISPTSSFIRQDLQQSSSLTEIRFQQLSSASSTSHSECASNKDLVFLEKLAVLCQVLSSSGAILISISYFQDNFFLLLLIFSDSIFSVLRAKVTYYDIVTGNNQYDCQRYTSHQVRKSLKLIEVMKSYWKNGILSFVFFLFCHLLHLPTVFAHDFWKGGRFGSHRFSQSNIPTFIFKLYILACTDTILTIKYQICLGSSNSHPLKIN